MCTRFLERAAAHIAFAALALGTVEPGWSMGLTSFVALPVEAGGAVMREQLERAEDAHQTNAFTSLAYGLTGKQTLLFDVPYRLSPSRGDQLGDLSAMYRRIVSQRDAADRTRRLGLLTGAIVPTGGGRDGAVQVGFVATLHRGRNELDADVLYQPGLSKRPDAGRYDVSWQHRLAPATYPDWGLAKEWHAVLEVGGRYDEGKEIVHRATAGLQWIHARWVLEGGIVRELNGPKDTRGLLSVRWHVGGR